MSEIQYFKTDLNEWHNTTYILMHDTDATAFVINDKEGVVEALPFKVEQICEDPRGFLRIEHDSDGYFPVHRCIPEILLIAIGVL